MNERVFRMTSMLRDAGRNDSEGGCRIYNHYAENTAITFAEGPVLIEQMRARIAEIRVLSLPRIPYRRETLACNS
jgi:L-amino acid N-acyltransferase YncA